ncbi:MAG: hypothetical protein L0Y72_20730 [Gemmataceae bacterium]|nr:hypothetical protein [Gemmataceae bacterium]MCI0741466.1 hypothetical protein [Gemmataceae bacterium]
MNIPILSLLAFGLIGANCHAADEPSAPPRTRNQFAAAMSQLKEGMPQADALALLGKPDDVRTEHDPGGISTVGTKEIWRYGTSGHLTTATLGQVYVDNKGRVQYVFGKGKPLPENLPEESELRRLLEALGQVPSYNLGHLYNPQKVIQAVNLLQPLGKEKALAVIEEFLRVASGFHDSGRDGVFLVLRTLFDVPDDPGHLPWMYVGAPWPSTPKDLRLLPRFPIALEGDIPFLLVTGYVLAGFPEQPESHVAQFRKQGRLRAQPLKPTAEPFKALEAFAKSRRWIFGSEDGSKNDEAGHRLLADQVVRLLDSIYRIEPDRNGALLPWGENAADRRRKIIESASAKAIRWAPEKNKYVFSDGTSLPERDVKHYRREIWKSDIPDLDVELSLERQSQHFLGVGLRESYEIDKIGPRAVLKVFRVDSPQ